MSLILNQHKDSKSRCTAERLNPLQVEFFLFFYSTIPGWFILIYKTTLHLKECPAKSWRAPRLLVIHKKKGENMCKYYCETIYWVVWILYVSANKWTVSVVFCHIGRGCKGIMNWSERDCTLQTYFAEIIWGIIINNKL